MKTQKSKSTYVSGELAIQKLREETFKCKKSLNSIRKHYWNLELILNDKEEIETFRYEIDENLKWLILYDGEWQKYDIEFFKNDIWLTNVMNDIW